MTGTSRTTVRERLFPRPRTRATRVATVVTIVYAVLYLVAALIELDALTGDQAVGAIPLPGLTVLLGFPAGAVALMVMQEFATVRYTVVAVGLVWLQAYAFWRLFVGVVLASTPTATSAA